MSRSCGKLTGIAVVVRSPLLRALAGSHATIVPAGWAFLAVYPLYMLNVLDLSARGVGFIHAPAASAGCSPASSPRR